MPTESIKTLTKDEQKFIVHYLREGGTKDVIWIAERKARVAAGFGDRVLRYKHVQEDLARRKATVEWAQAQQLALDESKVAAVADAQQKVTVDKLEAVLDKVLHLDPQQHAQHVLAALNLGLVYAGVIRNARTERVTPVAGGEAPQGQPYMYDSIFEEQRKAEQQPVDLMPTGPVPEPVRPVLKIPKAAAPAPEKPSGVVIT